MSDIKQSTKQELKKIMEEVIKLKSKPQSLEVKIKIQKLQQLLYLT